MLVMVSSSVQDSVRDWDVLYVLFFSQGDSVVDMEQLVAPFGKIGRVGNQFQAFELAMAS